MTDAWILSFDSAKYGDIYFMLSKPKGTSLIDIDRTFFRTNKPPKEKWQPFHIRLNKKLVDSCDFFSAFSPAPLFSQKAWDTLKNEISNDLVAVYPLESKLGIMYIICSEIIDCLDHDKSRIDYFPNSKKPLLIHEYVFDPLKIGTRLLFRIAEYPSGPTFVTTKFRNLIKEHSLVGLDFSPLNAGFTHMIRSGIK